MLLQFEDIEVKPNYVKNNPNDKFIVSPKYQKHRLLMTQVKEKV